MFKKLATAVCAAALMLGLTQAPANAAGSETRYAMIDGWDIQIAETGYCFMIKHWDRGTGIMLSYYPDQKAFSLIIGNDNWPIQPDASYPIRMVMDGYDKWEGTGTGFNRGHPGIRLFPMKYEFVIAMMQHYRVDFYGTRGHITGMQLNGSYNSVLSTIECANSLRGNPTPRRQQPRDFSA